MWSRPFFCLGISKKINKIEKWFKINKTLKHTHTHTWSHKQKDKERELNDYADDGYKRLQWNEIKITNYVYKYGEEPKRTLKESESNKKNIYKLCYNNRIDNNNFICGVCFYFIFLCVFIPFSMNTFKILQNKSEKKARKIRQPDSLMARYFFSLSLFSKR